ncbi:MAG: hypothetical protein AB9836_04385 [Aminipila sp.]
MTTEFWIQMIVYAVSLGSFGGVVMTKLSNLEKKQDIHNGLIARMYKVEERSKSNTHRLDGIEEELRRK